MHYIYRIGLAIAAIAMLQTSAFAGKFDSCPNPEGARRYVNSCLQENSNNTKKTCEARALDKLCSSESTR